MCLLGTLTLPEFPWDLTFFSKNVSTLSVRVIFSFWISIFLSSDIHTRLSMDKPISVGCLVEHRMKITRKRAKKLYEVLEEEKEKIREELPGYNCGGCGYGGCAAYAEALAEDGEDPGMCSPGGEEVEGSIEEILQNDTIRGGG